MVSTGWLSQAENPLLHFEFFADSINSITQRISAYGLLLVRSCPSTDSRFNVAVVSLPHGVCACVRACVGGWVCVGVSVGQYTSCLIEILKLNAHHLCFGWLCAGISLESTPAAWCRLLHTKDTIDLYFPCTLPCAKNGPICWRRCVLQYSTVCVCVCGGHAAVRVFALGVFVATATAAAADTSTHCLATG